MSLRRNCSVGRNPLACYWIAYLHQATVNGPDRVAGLDDDDDDDVEWPKSRYHSSFRLGSFLHLYLPYLDESYFQL